MRKLLFSLLPAFFFLSLFYRCSPDRSALTVLNLRSEYKHDPRGLDVDKPRLSWIVTATARNQVQSAYRILVASSLDKLNRDEGDLWDSGQLLSDRTINVPYGGKPLVSNQLCYWKVRVWDGAGNASAWSESTSWSMGLLDQSEWTAQWIGYDAAQADTSYGIKKRANGMKSRRPYRPLPCPFLRKDFELGELVQTAQVHVTALGLYELYINGQWVGEDYFTPGWTDYRDRIQYQTYEVSSLLQQGSNTIAAVLADGWYAGSMVNLGQHFYGKNLRLKLQLDIATNNDAEIQVVSDSTWRAAYGPILESDMHAGETFDARLAMPGWNSNGFDDQDWNPVVAQDTQTAMLQSYPGIPVRKIEEIEPVEIFEQSPGTYIVNMGQNFAGWARLKVSGTRGDSVVMRFAEKLNKDGSLFTRNLRTAACTDTYVLAGKETEVWEPRFTYRGYQFIEVKGYPGKLTKDKITGIVLHSDLPEAGGFSCSDTMINRLYSNIRWSQKSNYFEVPTDNPQRDERMGWLGDAHLFMRTASFNMDVSAFYNKWLIDVEDGQMEDGTYPCMAPRIFTIFPAAGWGDAGVICPWNFFQLYNDTSILERQYASMTRFMDFLQDTDSNYLSLINTFGDWQNVKSETPKRVIMTAFYKHDADLMAQIAAVLNKPEDVRKYESLSDSVKAAFNREFVGDSARVDGHTQTGYLLALGFDLLPEDERPMAVAQLVKTIGAKKDHLTTGILGTHLLLPVLTENGHLDLAYRLLQNRKYPSWGFQIDQGATTIWERWDSYSFEKGFHKDNTNSLNQYAYGSIGEWFFSTIAGINNEGPGYKHILIQPRPGKRLSSAEAEYQSGRGLIRSAWVVDGAAFELEVSIPANTDARIVIPGSDPTTVTEGGKPLAQVAGLEVIRQDSSGVEVKVGSGKYRFSSTYSR